MGVYIKFFLSLIKLKTHLAHFTSLNKLFSVGLYSLRGLDPVLDLRFLYETKFAVADITIKVVKMHIFQDHPHPVCIRLFSSV